MIWPVGQWFTAPLENRFPTPSLPERVDGIIVLGGALSNRNDWGRPESSLNSASERIFDFLMLMKKYPEAKAVYTSGSGSLIDDGREAAGVKKLLEGIGVDTSRILFENDARNTYENAVFSKQLVHPSQEQVWILVTSAMHMPRAVGIFKKNGWNIIPYPCDYESPVPLSFKPNFNLSKNLTVLDAAVHEYIGLGAYYITGKMDVLFPH